MKTTAFSIGAFLLLSVALAVGVDCFIRRDRVFLTLAQPEQQRSLTFSQKALSLLLDGVDVFVEYSHGGRFVSKLSITGEDVLGDFEEKYPIQQWLDSNTLRLSGPLSNHQQAARLIIRNEAPEVIPIVCIHVGGIMYLVFDLARTEERGISVPPAETSLWIAVTYLDLPLQGSTFIRDAQEGSEGTVSVICGESGARIEAEGFRPYRDRGEPVATANPDSAG